MMMTVIEKSVDGQRRLNNLLVAIEAVKAAVVKVIVEWRQAAATLAILKGNKGVVTIKTEVWAVILMIQRLWVTH